LWGFSGGPPDGKWQVTRIMENKRHAELLWHIVGNPFHPNENSSSWSSTVVQLAESLYQNNDCRLPLSDALEEAGHAELAEHFRKDEWHPKGCWVVDVILGKENSVTKDARETP
jgi:hypothetical protein